MVYNYAALKIDHTDQTGSVICATDLLYSEG